MSLGFFLFNFSSFLQEVVEITILTKLSDDVHVVGSLVDIVKFDDVEMVDFLHDLDLGLDVFHVVAVGEEPFVDHFHGYFLSALDYFAQVHVRV